MDREPLERDGNDLNKRLRRVEQILPTLATKADLAAAIEPLATKADVAKEGETTRRHFDAVAERLEGHIRLVAEGHLALDCKVEDLRTELKADIRGLDRRVMRLEADRLKK
jgi:hypothetical protein